MTAADDQEPIAIIGAACRLPGEASSLGSLWDMMSNVRTGHCKVPASRWDADLLHHPDPDRKGTMAVKHGYFLQQDVSLFDAPFFSTTAKEAAAMDPMKRLLLEVSYESIENAGIPMESLVNSDTACYVGCMTNDYELLSTRDMLDMGYSAATGTSEAMTANRVSWFFGLRGPSLTLDTACSSSLYALHLACQSLKLGESNQALVAGVNLMLYPNCMQQFSAIHMLSPEGISHSFDARANGYGRGEGIGCLVVKRLADALRDGDTVRAVIRNTGVNADGKTPSLTQPSAEAQASLIRRTYATAGLSLSSTEYFECHGTGTAVGDPIELTALASTIGAARAAAGLGPLYIGSVKPNVGHTEGCSGLAGVFKAMLCLERGMLVPTYDVHTVSPKLTLDEWHLALPATTIRWPSAGRRRISVNSFGFGGANAHVILDDAHHYLSERGLVGNHNTVVHADDDGSESGIDTGPGTPSSSSGNLPPPRRLFVLSARDQAGPQRLASAYAAAGFDVAAKEDGRWLDDLAYTLAMRRTAHDFRSAFVATSLAELRVQLEKPLAKPVRASRRDRNLIFVFTGQGAQWPAMGRQLLSHAVFQDSLRASQEYLAAHGCTWNVLEELFKTDDSNIALPEYSQTLCTVLQVALVDLLRHWNVVPRATIGHSSGEIAAAYAASRLSHSDAIKIAYVRGVSSAAVTQNGAMMAAGISRNEAASYLEQVPSGSAVIACINSPSSVTLSGDVDAIDALEKTISADGKFARKLKVGTAYHSPHMRSVAQGYLDRMGRIVPEEGDDTLMFSSLTGKLVAPQELTAQYWVSNMCAPVEFAAAFAELLSHQEQSGGTARAKALPVRWGGFVEVGPHSALQGPVQQNVAAASNQSAKDAPYVSMILRGKDATQTALAAAGQLWSVGFDVDLSAVNGLTAATSLMRPKVLTDLPTYPWNHTRGFWQEAPSTRAARFPLAARTDLLGVPEELQNDKEPRWRNHLRVTENPWIEDHKITGTILYPAAGMLVMVMEAALQSSDSSRKVRGFRLGNIAFERGLVVTAGDEATVQTRVSLLPHKGMSGEFKFTVYSTTTGASWTQHCHGTLALEYHAEMSEVDGDTLDPVWNLQTDEYQGIQQDDTAADVDVNDFYDHLEAIGMEYGPLFRNVVSLTSVPAQDAVYGAIEIPDTKAAMPANHEFPHIIHPATMDAIFHLLLATVNSGTVTQEAAVPYHVDSMFVAAEQPHGVGTLFHGYSRLTSRSMGGREVVGSLVVSDEDWSSPKIQVEGFALRQVTSADDAGESAPDNGGMQDKCAVITWQKDLDFFPIADDAARLGLEGKNTVASVKAWMDALTHKKVIGRTLIVVDDELRGLEDVALHVREEQGQRPGYESVEGLAMTASSLHDIQSSLHGHLETAFNIWDVGSGDELFNAGARYDLVLVLGLQGTEERLERLAKLHGVLDGEGHMVVFSVNESASLVQETLQRLGDSSALPRDNVHSAFVVRQGSKEVQMPTDVYLLLPSAPSAEVLSLAQATQTLLSTHEITSRSIRLTPESAVGLEGKYVISLVEAESPTIYSWTEAEFKSFYTIVSTIKHLFWITKGSLLESWAAGVEFAPAQGLLRVLRNEYPLALLQHLDLSAAFQLSDPASARFVFDIWKASLHENSETEFAELRGAVYIPRAVDAPGLDQDLQLASGSARPQRRPITDGGRAMKLMYKGGEHIWAEDDEAGEPLGSDMVEIDVKFIALGGASLSRDRKGDKALSGLAHQAASGVVRRCGSNVKSVVSGQSVVLIHSIVSKTRVRQHASLVAAVPKALQPQEAAAVARALVTSKYALREAARLERGESILIHDAATVLGQAAVQVAQASGAEIFALVDSAKQKEMLVGQFNIPADHIFDSQRRYFAAAINRATSFRGVNVILASRRGPAVQDSAALLANSGYFLDLESNSSDAPDVFLPKSKRNASLIRIDMSSVQQQKPGVVERLFQEVFEGPVAPISSTTVFSVGNVNKAIEALHASQDTAVVISMDDESPVLMLPPLAERLSLDENATYVLAGGLGALGLNIANMMVEHGAKHLVFLSRSAGSKNEADLKRFRSQGVSVEAHRCDVNDGESVSRVFSKLRGDGRVIKGLVQCAMVLEDAIFENMTYDKWTRAFQPKTRGSRNLLSQLSRSDDPFFILLSSITGIIGNTAQANYASGNTFEDALALHARTHLGIRATSIDVGLVADSSHFTATGGFGDLQSYLTRYQHGWVGLRCTLDELCISLQAIMRGSTADASPVPAQFVLGMGAAFNRTPGSTGFERDNKFNLRLAKQAASNPGEEGDGSMMSLAEKLSAATTLGEASEAVEHSLKAQIAAAFGVDVDEIDGQQPFPELGVDSLKAVEIRNRVLKEMQSDVSVFELLSATPLAEVAVKIATKSALLRADVAASA